MHYTFILRPFVFAIFLLRTLMKVHVFANSETQRADKSSKGRRGISSPGRFNKISLSYRLPSFKEYRSDELPDNRPGRKPWQIFIPTIAHVIANITIPACLTGYSRWNDPYNQFSLIILGSHIVDPFVLRLS